MPLGGNLGEQRGKRVGDGHLAVRTKRTWERTARGSTANRLFPFVVWSVVALPPDFFMRASTDIRRDQIAVFCRMPLRRNLPREIN